MLGPGVIWRRALPGAAGGHAALFARPVAASRDDSGLRARLGFAPRRSAGRADISLVLAPSDAPLCPPPLRFVSQLASIGLPNEESYRRDLRELLFTAPNLNEYISGVVRGLSLLVLPAAARVRAPRVDARFPLPEGGRGASGFWRGCDVAFAPLPPPSPRPAPLDMSRGISERRDGASALRSRAAVVACASSRRWIGRRASCALACSGGCGRGVSTRASSDGRSAHQAAPPSSGTGRGARDGRMCSSVRGRSTPSSSLSGCRLLPPASSPTAPPLLTFFVFSSSVCRFCSRRLSTRTPTTELRL